MVWSSGKLAFFSSTYRRNLLIERVVSMDKIQDILAAIARAKTRKYTEEYGLGEYAEREGGLDHDADMED